MIRFLSLFTLDLRSVAFFRVIFGSILLFDIVSRLPYAELFLSDYGALSRADLLAVIDRPWSFSIYMMFGETSQVIFLLVVNACFAILLIFGLWTRFASIVCWGMLLSLQHRNPLVLNGGDTLFSLYAFWMMFLPLNARWSIDRYLVKNGSEGINFHVGNKYMGIPAFAIMMQTVLVYVFTVALKTGDLWKSGEVVHYVIRNQSLIKPLAVWFQQFESLHVLASKLTYHWEWFGCVLLLFPFANSITRSVAIFGYVLMHAAFGLMLDLAIFSPVSIMSWLILLPAFWWNGLESLKIPNFFIRVFRQLGLSVSSLLKGKGGPIIQSGRISNVLTSLVLALVAVWCLRGLPESPVSGWIPKPIDNTMYLLKLRQKWSMFAPNPSRYSEWYALEVQLANGDSVDLFNPSVPFILRRPEVFTERLPDRRWGKYMANLKKGRNARLRDDYIDYLVGRWNDVVGPSSKIEKASLLVLRERIGDDGNYYDREIKTLSVVYVEGVAQIIENDFDGYESEEDL